MCKLSLQRGITFITLLSMMLQSFIPFPVQGSQLNSLVAGGMELPKIRQSNYQPPAFEHPEPRQQLYSQTNTTYDFSYLLSNSNEYQWHTFYGSFGADFASDITTDSSGNIYVVGLTGGSTWYGTGGTPIPPLNPAVGSGQFITIAKFSSNGSLVWYTFFGNHSASAIVLDQSGNIYVAGSSSNWYGPGGVAPLHAYSSDPTGADDNFILKLSNNGIYQWHTFYGGTDNDFDGINDIAVDKNGNIITVGVISRRNGSNDWVNTTPALNPFPGNVASYGMVIGKFSSTGDHIWHTIYGNSAVSGRSNGYGVVIDSNSDIFISGSSNGGWNGPGGQLPLNSYGTINTTVILKLSENGDYQWHSFYGETNSFYNNTAGTPKGHSGLALDNSGNLIVVGTSSNNWSGPSGASPLHAGSYYDVVVLKVRNDGQYLWHTFYGSPSDFDNGYDVAVDTTGNIYIAGESSATWNGPNGEAALDVYSGGWDILGMKLSSTGTYQWHEFYGANYSSFDDSGRGVALSGNSVYFTGHIYRTWNGPNGELPLNPATTTTDWVVISNKVAPTTVSDATILSSNLGMDGNISCTAVCTQAYEGGPINTRTGGYDYSSIDISLQSGAGELSFERTYSSQALSLTSLGYGWTHNHDMYLTIGAYSNNIRNITLKGHTANKYTFTQTNGSTATIPEPGVYATLVQGPSSFILTDKAQNIYEFNLTTGRLLSHTTPTGQKILYTFDNSGRLTKISDQSGTRYLTLAYSGKGTKIVSITDHTGRKVSYGYDANNNLISVTDPLGKIWKYTYDTGHRVLQVLDPDNKIIERTEYDSQGRAVRQYDGANNLVVGLIYNADGTTTIRDALNNNETHTYDYRKTLTNQAGPASGTTSTTYDANFRPENITDANGNTTELVWNGNGTDLLQLTDPLNGQVSLTYDVNHNVTSIVDQNNYLTTYTYSGTNMTSMTDALNKTWNYTYTAQGHLASQTDPLGHTTSYTYNTQGQRLTMTNPLGKTWTYTYDTLGRLLTTTDPLGRVTKNDYDAASRLIKVTRNYNASYAQNHQNQWNIVTQYQYDVRGNQTAVIDTYGRTTTYQYDAAGRLFKTIDVAGNTTTNTYDAKGQLILVTDPLGRVNSYQYDAAGRVIAVTDADGKTTSTTYNLDGTVATTTDASNHVTSYTYDELKRIKTITDPMGGVTSYNYDAAGNMISVTDPHGTTTYQYDALGRVIKQTAPNGGITETFYDDAGNMIQTIDPRGYTTTYAYDNANQLLTVTDARGSVTSYTYDDAGRRISMTNANNNTTTYTYDVLDRVVNITDPLGNVTQAQYDAMGNTTSQTDPNNNTTTFQYDNLYRLVTQTNALNGATQFTYDGVGNRLTVTDPNNHMTTTTYDDLNRPVSVLDANGNTTSTGYDATGNVTTSTDGLNHTTTFGYDSNNRQTSVADALGNLTQYAYNTAGDRISMTDANGVVTRFEYNNMGWLTAVVENYLPAAPVDTKTNVRTEYTYDLNGNRLSVKDGSGHISNFTYDELNRLVQESDPLGNTWTYYYDAVGNQTSMVDANGATTQFTYDDANRLIGINYPTGTPDVTFTYDAGGRRIGMTDGAGSTTWTFDKLNRPTLIQDPFGTTVSYGYDAAGNRTTLTYPGAATVIYTYDAGNRLTTVNGLSSIVNYTYDAADRLTGVTRPNGVNTAYTYDNANRLLTLAHTLGVGNLALYQYTYDAVGNRTQVIENVGIPAGSLPTAMPTATNSPTTTPTVTETATASPTATGTETETPLPTETFTPTVTEEPTFTPSFTPTPTFTPAPTDTPTETPTQIAFNGSVYVVSLKRAPKTPTPTLTRTPTWTPTITLTPTSVGPTDTPTFTPTATITTTPLPPPVLQTVTINYVYDPLNRLSEANYSDGKFYHYTYDLAGNRVSQQTHLGDDTYVYDSANRLSSVNSTTYTWDANGNLLNDGENIYAYDSANRLTSANGATYTYNGLGDRLTQNGVHYTLDLNTGLTQVLSDGSNTYLYGLGRIAERQDGANEYYLGDALGSVRQLTDGYGEVVLTQSYDPYGNNLQSLGTGQTSYGFTGETTDANGLVYLRARYYNPLDGRFISRDTWAGELGEPITLNKWLYANSNPTYYVDPAGQAAIPAWLAVVIGRAIVGGLIGGTVGYGFGYGYGCLTYEWAIAGDCGCEMQQLALNMTASQWKEHHAVGGAISGAIAGAIGSQGPAGLILVGVGGLYFSGSDIIKTWHIIQNETGWTKCTASRLLIDIAFAAISLKTIKLGWKQYKATGDPFALGNSSTLRPVNSRGVPYPRLKVAGYGEIPFPDPPYTPNNSSVLRNSFSTSYKSQFKNWWIEQGRPWPSGIVQIHHIKPLKFGGTNTFENLVPLSSTDHLIFTRWWASFKP